MVVMYQGIKSPNTKINSCVEGRIFSAFEYLMNNEKMKGEFYYLLSECKLEYEYIEENDYVDPWYYQPIRIVTKEGDSLAYGKGFSYICDFVEKYGVKCRKTDISSVQNLLCVLESAFYERMVPIVMIDQFKYRKSSKFQKQEKAQHALLLSGIDSEKRIFWVSDSGNTINNRYSITYEELQEAAIGSVLLLSKEKKITNMIFMPEKKDILVLEKESCAARINFLKEITMQREENVVNERFCREGYAISIRYKIMPYIKMSLLLCRKFNWDRLEKLFANLADEWEILANKFTKAVVSKKVEKIQNQCERIMEQEVKIVEQIDVT